MGKVILALVALLAFAAHAVNAQAALPQICVLVGSSNPEQRGEYMQDAMNGGVLGVGGSQEAVADFVESDPGFFTGPLGNVTYSFVDNAIQGGTDEVCQYECVVQNAIDAGCDLIIGVSFQYTSAVADASAANPDVDFGVIDISYDPPLDNVEAFVWREDQSGFLAGVVAGEVAIEQGTYNLGVVGGIPIPPVKRFVNGFIVGARDACPQCTIYELYANSFGSQEEGFELAQRLLDAGVDIAFCAGGRTGSSACTKMAQNDVFVIGVDVDEYFSTFGGGSVDGADKILTSAKKSTSRAVQFAIQCFLFRFEDCAGRTNVLDASNNGIELAPCHEACEYYAEGTEKKVQDLYNALGDRALQTGVDPYSGDLMEGDLVDLTSNSTYADATP